MAASDSASAPLVALHGISRSFPGCLANDAIDLVIERGRVHALLGENGAGKSTLVKILYGLLQADAGFIEWQGERVVIDSPARARRLGIAMVFQHFSLFESLSVHENIALGMGVDANAALHRRIVEVSAQYGLPLEPDRSVYSLSVGERQRIEIVRCLLQSPALLIMDEPTSVLTPQEIRQLFETLRRLADEGLAILYISHKLEEIRELCHDATILRAGRVVATADPTRRSARELAALMIGDELPAASAPGGSPSGAALLELEGLSLPAIERHAVALSGLELDVAAGEIVGIAGVAGNGQNELLQALSGERRVAHAPSLKIRGEVAGHLSAGERRRRGLCTVPEERLGHATVPEMTLAENAFLTARYRLPLVRHGLMAPAGARRFAHRIIDRFHVQCRGTAAVAMSLSGGNLQKFIVGREILQQPDILVVSQPTWGVDAGAASAIHVALRALADAGAAVLVISQDLDELLTLTTRIAALCGGRLSALYPTASVNAEAMGLLMGGDFLAQQRA